MHVLDDLLGAERNEHADHDDANFAGNFTPAMQRFGKMNVHRLLSMGFVTADAVRERA
jgi:hypothetical protein